MRAFDLLADGFPHGTVDGYREGCKSSHCPAAIVCRDVFRRYSGDAEFRALIDQGLSVQAIVDDELNAAAVREQEARAAVLEHKRAAEAARAERRRQAAAERRAASLAVVPVAPSGWESRRSELQEALIGAERALEVARVALEAHLAAGPSRRAWTDSDDVELRRLWGERLSDTAIGRLMGRAQALVSVKRRGLGLESNGVYGQKAAS